MSTFRSRQRANQRHDLTQQQKAEAKTPLAQERDSTTSIDKPRLSIKKAQSDPRSTDNSPRDPYSSRRPGPARPEFGRNKPDGEARSRPRSADSKSPWSDNNAPSEQRQGRNTPHGHKQRPGNDNRAPFANRSENRPEGSVERKQPSYTRDRGPSGKKPLHFLNNTEPDAPDTRSQPERRSSFIKSTLERGDAPQGQVRSNRFRPDAEGTRQRHEPAPRRHSSDSNASSPAKRPSFIKERQPSTTERQPTERQPEKRNSLFRSPVESLAPVQKPHHKTEHRARSYTETPLSGSQERTSSMAVSHPRDSELALFISCPRGLETVLAGELGSLGGKDIQTMDGGVGCNGNSRLLMNANLYSRTASRVLLKLASGSYQHEQDIYRLACNIDWPRWFDVSQTIKVKTDGIGSQVKSLDFVSLKVKDAVCDRFRQAQQGRPNVDTHAPDIRIQVFLTADTATIYLDTSGEPLFKRGWRQETGEAPLRENLAAGILLLAGYNGSQPLLDPMCGSGTFLIEAADIALNRAPGRNRRFAFENLRTFDQALWEALCQQARHDEKPMEALEIQGADISPAMVSITRNNIQRAGLSQAGIRLTTQDIREVIPSGEHGLLVCNPPYGIRLDEQNNLAALYPQIGDWLKAHFAGWTAYLFTADLRLPSLIHLSVKRKTPLFNGSLACRLFSIHMVAGSARRTKPQSGQ